MYIRESDQKYPISDAEIRVAHPRTAFPEPMPDVVEILADPLPLEFDGDGAPIVPEDGPLEVVDRYVRVANGEKPDPAPWHEVVEGPPVQGPDGTWVKQWKQVPKTKHAVIADISAWTQKRLDDTAAARGFGGDGMSPTLSITTYIDDPNPRFAADAAAFKAFRSETWTFLYGLLDAVDAGDRPMPASCAELAAMMPTITWPS